MSYRVLATSPFERKLKKLLKKHRSLRSDLQTLITQLTDDPIQGSPLGHNCYKIRLAISSKGRGKSGGARIITHVLFVDQTVYLLDIYDKSAKSSITDRELKLMIELLTNDE